MLGRTAVRGRCAHVCFTTFPNNIVFMIGIGTSQILYGVPKDHQTKQGQNRDGRVMSSRGKNSACALAQVTRCGQGQGKILG